MMDGRQSTGPASPLLTPVYTEHVPVTAASQHVNCCEPYSDTLVSSVPHQLHTTNIKPIFPELGITCSNTENKTDTDIEKAHNFRRKPSGKKWFSNRSGWKRAWKKSKSEDHLEKEEDSAGQKAKSSVSFSRKQWLLLMVLCLAGLTSSFAVCLFPPFFPRIAQEKGCSSTIFGLIIGTNCLTAFLVTPIVGKKLKTIGVKFAFSAGLFCSGGCCVLSGFLEWMPEGSLFVIMAIAIRMTQATANAGISTATFAYIGLEFPDCVAKVFAWTRTTMNLAQMFGPILGGALLELGGFKMPFFIMGTIQMAMTLVSFYFLPDYYDEDKKSEKSEEVKIWKIFTIGGIYVSFITFIFSTMSNGFLSITLEPQVLRKYGLSPLYVGLLFGLKDGANSLASPFWGYVCDRYWRVKIFILVSSCLALMSFFLLGPFPGIPLHRTLSVVILALILNGIGIGGQQVAGVVDAMREVVGAGFPDVAGTHGFVAGLWASLSGVGRFLSRTVSGFLVDTMGFRKASVIVVALHAFVVVMTVVYLLLCREKAYKKNQEELSADPQRASNAKRKRETILTTTPTEPLTTKTVTVNVRYREDIEDSIFCGSAPIPTSTRYVRSSYLSGSQSFDSV